MGTRDMRTGHIKEALIRLSGSELVKDRLWSRPERTIPSGRDGSLSARISRGFAHTTTKMTEKWRWPSPMGNRVYGGLLPRRTTVILAGLTA